MKTITVLSRWMIVFVAGIIMSSAAFAGNPAQAPAIRSQKIQEKIAQTIKFPETSFAKEYSGESVEVTFILTDDGKIEVKSVSCDCKELADNIREQLTNVYCEGVIQPYNQHYKVKIRFENC